MPEYNLSFIEAMRELANGKEVKNEHYPWVFYNQNGAVMFEAEGETFRKYWFDTDDVATKWKVVE